MTRSMKYLRIVIGVILGTAIYSAGIAFFMSPNNVITGGVTGIGMIINMLTGLPLGVTMIAMNIPLFFIAWRKLGLKFMAVSLIAMILVSVFVDILELLEIKATSQPVIAALYGGLLTGLGQGILYYIGASSGGLDIVSKLLRKRYQYINLGHIILAMDGVILAVFALVFRAYDNAMFSLICIYLSSKIIDLILYGFNYSKVCYIITDYSEEVCSALTEHLHRGITMLEGKGAYSGKKKEVLMCAIKRQQIVEMKKEVKAIDPSAFIIVTEAREVFGKGFESMEEAE